MKYKEIIQEMIDEAKHDIKNIVLPESEDLRILEAASVITKEKIAKITLIGNKKDIMKRCDENSINISDVVIEDNKISNKRDIYANSLYELRKHKGMTLEKAYELLNDNLYFATMMVKSGDVDGMVCGASHSTADSLRPALQIIKARDGLSTVSSFFIMETSNKNLGCDGKFIFADCGLVDFPTEDELVDIVKESYDSFRELLKKDAKIAMLSYSTLGSAKHENITKIENVVKKVRNIDKDIKIDGELQLDAAVISEVAKLKAPNSEVAGNANILIFPNLESGNIGYKIAERFGNMVALGPITQGLNKPVNDLSRGCSVADIIGVVAITCIQARKNI